MDVMLEPKMPLHACMDRSAFFSLMAMVLGCESKLSTTRPHNGDSSADPAGK